MLYGIKHKVSQRLLKIDSYYHGYRLVDRELGVPWLLDDLTQVAKVIKQANIYPTRYNPQHDFRPDEISPAKVVIAHKALETAQ